MNPADCPQCGHPTIINQHGKPWCAIYGNHKPRQHHKRPHPAVATIIRHERQQQGQ